MLLGLTMRRSLTTRSSHAAVNLAETSVWVIHLFGQDHGVVHFIGWKSGLIKRMCRSTFRAETHGCMYAVEAGVSIRALLAELHGKRIKHDSNWEETCAATKRHLWMTDCESLHSYVTNPSAAGAEDKHVYSQKRRSYQTRIQMVKC